MHLCVASLSCFLFGMGFGVCGLLWHIAASKAFIRLRSCIGLIMSYGMRCLSLAWTWKTTLPSTCGVERPPRQHMVCSSPILQQLCPPISTGLIMLWGRLKNLICSKSSRTSTSICCHNRHQNQWHTASVPVKCFLYKLHLDFMYLFFLAVSLREFLVCGQR